MDLMKLTKAKLVEKIGKQDDEIEDLKDIIETIGTDLENIEDMTDVFSDYLDKIYGKDHLESFKNLQEARQEADCLKSLYKEL